MNVELIITVVSLGVIYELSKLVFKIATTLFFQAEAKDAFNKGKLSIKDKIKIAEMTKKARKVKR